MTSVPPPSSTALPVSAALNVPTATSYPSVNCLQWSSDGQLCFVTKTAIYILVGRYLKYFQRKTDAIYTDPRSRN